MADIKSLDLSQSLTIQPQWPHKNKVVTTPAIIFCQKYITLLAKDLFLFDEEHQKKMISKKVMIQLMNRDRRFVVELEEDGFQCVDMDDCNLIACIELKQTISNKQVVGGRVIFMNLAERLFVKGFGKIDVSIINQQPKEKSLIGMYKSQKHQQFSRSQIFAQSLQKNAEQDLHIHLQRFQKSQKSQRFEEILKELDKQKEKIEQIKQLNFKKHQQNLSIYIKQPLFEEKKVNLLKQKASPVQNIGLKSIPASINFNKFLWEEGLSYSKLFMINGNKVVRTEYNQNQSYQITSARTLSSQKNEQLAFNIKYGQKGYGIGIGIVTSNKKNLECSSAFETIQFQTWKSSKQGSISIDKRKVKADSNFLYVEDGALLKMEVNLKMGSIIFKVGLKSEAQYNLNENHWKKQDIYVCVWLAQKGATITVV